MGLYLDIQDRMNDTACTQITVRYMDVSQIR